MMKPTISGCSRILALGALLYTPSLLALTVDVQALDAAPSIDGADVEWANVEATRVPLKNDKAGGKSDVDSVSIKAGVYGERVYVCLQWKDDSNDDQHKPYVWDNGKNKYVAGPQREDRVALQFAMSGDYSTDWLSGHIFTADMWHWKAARSNPSGLAHDKSTSIGTESRKKSFKATAKNGLTVYIRRPSDAGDKLYRTKRYKEKAEDNMPKYILNENVSGSVADVKAKGVWKDGMWTVEFSRKLDTGHSDDVAFQAGNSVLGGIAVFNHSGDDDHSYSQVLTFQF